MKYKVYYCCMPHPLYAEMEMEADNDRDAMKKADALLDDRIITGWYFNADNIDYRDVELRQVERADESVLFSRGFGGDVQRPDHEEKCAAVLARVEEVFGKAAAERLKAGEKPRHQWHALFPDLTEHEAMLVGRLVNGGRLQILPPRDYQLKGENDTLPPLSK
jgi:hypothetical protein